jgi:hypothetical protein
MVSEIEGEVFLELSGGSRSLVLRSALRDPWALKKVPLALLCNDQDALTFRSSVSTTR